MRLKEFILLCLLSLFITASLVSFFYIKTEKPELYSAISNSVRGKIIDASKDYTLYTLRDTAQIYSSVRSRFSPEPPSSEPLDGEISLASKKNYDIHITDETSVFFDKARGVTILTGGAANIVYFNQKDDRWKDINYGEGTDPIGGYGRGPTAVAMIVSSLTQDIITPVQAAQWARESGYYCYGSGSYHSIVPGISSFGLKVSPLDEYTTEALMRELNTGKVIVALMHKGHFASEGHFIILRGTTLDGKILIADPQSIENSQKAWEAELFIDEAKYGANNGGPLWTIETN